ncbi:hypothetical protein TURU_106425 [Turdus rufiventris]|nr:hypothetical protein TURU_106425 [Turdus rufiventris]
MKFHCCSKSTTRQNPFRKKIELILCSKSDADNFLTWVTKKQKIQNALLDLILRNKEELALYVTSGSSLGTSDCKIVDFRDKTSKLKDHSLEFKGSIIWPIEDSVSNYPIADDPGKLSEFQGSFTPNYGITSLPPTPEETGNGGYGQFIAHSFSMAQ